MKILIEVVVPGNGRSYDIKLDDNLTVDLAKEKIIEQITVFENDCISFDKNAVLFLANVGINLPGHMNLRKAGVSSGNKIYLL